MDFSAWNYIREFQETHRNLSVPCKMLSASNFSFISFITSYLVLLSEPIKSFSARPLIAGAPGDKRTCLNYFNHKGVWLKIVTLLLQADLNRCDSSVITSNTSLYRQKEHGRKPQASGLVSHSLTVAYLYIYDFWGKWYTTSVHVLVQSTCSCCAIWSHIQLLLRNHPGPLKTSHCFMYLHYHPSSSWVLRSGIFYHFLVYSMCALAG